MGQTGFHFDDCSIIDADEVENNMGVRKIGLCNLKFDSKTIAFEIAMNTTARFEYSNVEEIEQ